MENRQIKFRGWFQGINGTEMWVYGYLVKQTNGNWEITNGETSWTVDNVGEFTGFKDRCGTEIYEGDIIECAFEKSEVLLANFPEGKFEFGTTKDAVIFKDGAFCVEAEIPKKEVVPLSQFYNVCKVVDDIY
jgi:hypothetical protein